MSSFSWKTRHLKNINYLINRINKDCRFYIMVCFYILCIRLLRERAWCSCFKKLRFLKKVTLFLKNNTLKKNVICLINQINFFCTLYMIAHFYRFHMWLEKEKNILPWFLRIMTSEKNYFISLKTWLFEKCICL